MDVATLTLESAVMHQIAKGQGGSASISLSEAEAILTTADRVFIMHRLIRALQNHRVPVSEADPTDVTTGAAIAAQILRGNQSLVAGSRALAERLAKTQHHMASEGLILVGEVRDAATDTGLLVAKLEHEQGIQAVAQKSHGLNTFAVTVIPDLVLSDSGKVYKVGLFPLPAAGAAVTADVVDRQASNRVVAHYFLSQYLGCQLVEKPDVLTERFVDGTQTFIASLNDATRAAELQVAVLAELQSQRVKINVPDFARDHLMDNEEGPFRSAMSNAGVPWRSIEKDLARVKNRIQIVSIKVDTGVLVLAPLESIRTEGNPGGSVTIGHGTEHAVVIDGDVTDIEGSRGRG